MPTSCDNCAARFSKFSMLAVTCVCNTSPSPKIVSGKLIRAGVATVSKTKELKKRYGVHAKKKISRQFWKPSPVSYRSRAVLSARDNFSWSKQAR